MTQDIILSPIAWIDTPFSEKFGIPRQSQSLSQAFGSIKFTKDINVENACRGLDEFSHLWITFIFHAHIDKKWSDTVRPPRLGGNQRVGVFASRATHRPNPIGLSLVKNEGLDKDSNLTVSGVDLLSGTPILDIKPYLDYADNAINAKCAYAETKPPANKTLIFSEQARKSVKQANIQHLNFGQLLDSVLGQDPRPAYKKQEIDDPKQYYLRLYNWEITWSVKADNIHVEQLKRT